MRMKRFENTDLAKRQQGAILLVVLIVVAVMTLGGVAAMRSTNVDTLLARSANSKLDALLLSENALITGEIAVCTYLDNASLCTGPMVVDFDASNSDGLHLGRELINMDGVSAYTDIGHESAGTNQSYIIEYVDVITPQGSSLAIGNNTVSDMRNVFRITAYAESPNGGVSVVQSLYAARR